MSTPTPTPKGKKGRPKGYKMSEETKAKIAATRAANKKLKENPEEVFHVTQTEI